MRVASTQYPVPSETREFRATRYWVLGTGYFFFRRQSQPKHRNHSLPRHIHFRFRRIRQIERLAMLAAVDLGVRPPRFFHVAASLLDHILGIEPALQVSAAELAFFVFLVAGALPGLLNFDFVMRKLCGSLRSGSRDFASRQSTYPHSRGTRAAGFGPTTVIVLEAERPAQAAISYARPIRVTGLPRPE